VQVHGRALGLPERTFSAAGSKLRWNEWLTFTEKYSDLSADARVEIRVYGSAGPRASVLLGSASAPLFDERQQLVEGDVTLRFELAAAHCDPSGGCGSVSGSTGEDEAEMRKLEAMAARHEEALAAAAQPGLGWLDRPTYQLIEVTTPLRAILPCPEREHTESTRSPACLGATEWRLKRVLALCRVPRLAREHKEPGPAREHTEPRLTGAHEGRLGLGPRPLPCAQYDTRKHMRENKINFKC
jgi:hypothetical protein